jgi:hypothetical protein
VLTLIIIALLVVTVGAVLAEEIVFGVMRKALGGGKPEPKQLGAGDVLRERGLKELKVGDVVTLDGKDYVCEGVIEYDEDGHRWVGARLVDGAHVVWCVVGLERVGNQQVRVLEHDTTTDIAGYPPEALVIGEVRFTLDKRGTATCRLHGDLGNLLGGKTNRPEGTVERCRWWLYSASSEDTVVLEQWGADYRVLKGKKVRGDMIDLIPGS